MCDQARLPQVQKLIVFFPVIIIYHVCPCPHTCAFLKLECDCNVPNFFRPEAYHPTSTMSKMSSSILCEFCFVVIFIVDLVAVFLNLVMIYGLPSMGWGSWDTLQLMLSISPPNTNKNASEQKNESLSFFLAFHFLGSFTGGRLNYKKI